MNIKELQEEVHAVAKEKGWHDTPCTTGDLISLCHAELSEAFEQTRISRNYTDIFFNDRVGKKPEGFAIELADLIMRVLDIAELYKIDLEQAIKIKLAYNKTRPHRHGGKLL